MGRTLRKPTRFTQTIQPSIHYDTILDRSQYQYVVSDHRLDSAVQCLRLFCGRDARTRSGSNIDTIFGVAGSAAVRAQRNYLHDPGVDRLIGMAGLQPGAPEQIIAGSPQGAATRGLVRWCELIDSSVQPSPRATPRKPSIAGRRSRTLKKDAEQKSRYDSVDLNERRGDRRRQQALREMVGIVSESGGLPVLFGELGSAASADRWLSGLETDDNKKNLTSCQRAQRNVTSIHNRHKCCAVL